MTERIEHTNKDMQLARSLKRSGIPKATFYPWLRDEARPSWLALQKIMNVYRHHGISPLEAVKRFWGEVVGDPCPCGCTGKKVLPDDPRARTLAIELSCAQCGVIRQYRYQKKTDRHSRLCAVCSRSNERVERIEFTCAGYRDHGVIRHAKNCPRTRLLAPYQIKNRELRKKRKPHLIFDASSRTYLAAEHINPRSLGTE